ncbi:N-acetyllactosaminide beta-1,3-N-acetylglucosaminyltransferase 4 isoform X2 [Malaclemys terrapin pileata]|uniref:N-acetyllactosaminide beta-1,3-N-acetylglucosaminyltransferase 4 isoform X2 n=1 Tax=Malaclemys terrapin pileata TaxID=2991368 RepID=UPI0023A7E25C|nr:N-acetyllactosaminide beta-1,3-N-acetylglucosaminyltransferase 4 isoform X2 [Malaclemys terrapin pileata]
MGGLSASAAFREHLRRLCLGEFPCGAGSWNRSRFELRKRKPGGNAARREADAGTAQHQEIGTPSEESLETLMEFVSSQDSPWALPPDCSPEDQHLRELAVQSPQLIRDNFIFLFFRSLRIVDKGVNEVDENLLKFQNLEELILSANQISKINSAHLPRTLKVLELCGNEIVGLQDLCSHPPPELQHLGLGYNRLLGSSEDKYLTAEFWPNLLSLDLSFNNFTDLLGIVSKLATLWRLRTLVLLGNPLVLIPGYRGFVIDSLPKLCILDDRNISPDEKHQFHGLSSKPDLIVNKAQLVVSVGKIKGVPNPIKPEELESGPESPVITHSYYVTYEFVEREKAEDTNNAEVIKFHQSQMVATPNPGSPPESVDTGGLESPAMSSLLQQEPPANRANRHLTPRKPWAETIECSHRREHVTGDLVALKAFLMTGTTVTVVEEKLKYCSLGTRLFYLARCFHGPLLQLWLKMQARRGRQRREKQRRRSQRTVGNKQKKKKESPIELRSDPPLLRSLGSGHVNLESLLTGDQLVAVVCDFGVLITEETTQPPSPKEKDGKKSKDKNKKTKTGGESPASQKTTVAAKGKGKNKESPEGKEVQEIQPVPLTVEFQVQLIQWTTAFDAQHQ